MSDKSNKKSFILYQDQQEIFENLTDNKVGKLIKAIFQYAGGSKQELTHSLNVAFIPIRQNLDRNFEKWERIRERNIANGKLGGRPKAKITQNNPDNQDGYFGNPKNLVNVNANVNVNKKEKEFPNKQKLDDKTPTRVFEPPGDEILDKIDSTYKKKREAKLRFDRGERTNAS